MIERLLLCLAFLSRARVALAHEGAHAAPAVDLRWTYDPWLTGALVLAAALYIRGALVLWRRAGEARTGLRRRVCAFLLGWLTLVLSLLSPLDGLSDLLFSAHMSQHELLMLVAAPLLVYAQSFTTYVWALPSGRRHELLRLLQRPRVMGAARALSGPVAALVLHGFVRWIWHLPALFEAALRSEWVHGFQHFTFFASAALFWWALLLGRYGRLGYGVSVLFVFATSLHTGALGALIAFSRAPIYPLYGERAGMARLDALGDQQLAGLIMWVGAGALFMLLGLALFLAWMGEVRRRVERGTVAALVRRQDVKGSRA